MSTNLRAFVQSQSQEIELEKDTVLLEAERILDLYGPGQMELLDEEPDDDRGWVDDGIW